MTTKEIGSSLTQEKLKEFLSYNKATGEFRWRKRSGRSIVGAVSGWTTNFNYRLIRIKTEDHLAHRLAWLYEYGVWPNGEIDHIDRNRSNNAISNLRVANRVNQGANSPKHKNNTSGFRGVFRDRKRWVAAAWTGGKAAPKRVTFGRCDTPEEAAAAFDAGAKKLWGDFYQPQLPAKQCSA
jgi:hypothetical protein